MANARIKFVREEEQTIVTLHQGIKKGEQSAYENDSRYHGGNGTYGKYSSERDLKMRVCVYATETKPQHDIEISIRENVLKMNNWERLSQKRLNQVKEKLKGQKITVNEHSNNTVLIDPSIFIMEG